MIRVVPRRDALKALTRSGSVPGGSDFVAQRDTCLRTPGFDNAGDSQGNPGGKDGEEYFAGSTSSM